MMKWSAYARLLRLNKPVGILLLWYPTAWALWIGNQGHPPINLLVLFLIGTVLMRSAGCVLNDIADRNIDKFVARTKLRPLTSGEVSLNESLFLLFLLLFCALLVVVKLPWSCFYWACCALAITAIYPFCKRFINAPQVVLGFAFSFGLPMVFEASNVPLNFDLLILFVINFSWIVAYDTMYAMTDKEDDLKIGVKSTAIYFGRFDQLIIGFLLLLMHGLWLYLALMSQLNMLFYLFWGLALLVLFYQMKLISKREPSDCFLAFRVSVYYGALMWLAVVV